MKMTSIAGLLIVCAAGATNIYAYCVKKLANNCGGTCGNGTTVCDRGWTDGDTSCSDFSVGYQQCITYASCALGAPGNPPTGYQDVGCGIGSQACFCSGGGTPSNGPQTIVTYTDCDGTCNSSPGGPEA